ncbi:MAG: CoA-binding protein [Thermodesulfobacteriota bacterium]|nr:CoA-binding protein [Thermodesulfobacteriota bacterium]
MEQTDEYSESSANIACLFEPESVAVIGSLRESWFGGYVVVKHLQKYGFSGKIYPINPKCDTVLGVKAYPTIGEVPGSIDLAIIITSYRAFPRIIEECAEKKVRAGIIVSDGFAEKDEEGAKLQKEIADIAKRVSMRLIGPNTVGLVNTDNGLMTNPYLLEYDNIYPGSIALCGQTGLIGAQALPLEDMHYGISKICAVGNKCDVDEADILEYLKNDINTKVIAMHLEDVKDGRRFIEKAKETVVKKPVLVLKAGRTKESTDALASHTGSLAGEDRLYDAAMKQAGIIRVNNHVELLEFSRMFAGKTSLTSGNRVAIVTYTGGFGVMGVDAAVKSGLTLADYTSETKERLRKIFPSLSKNPTDLGPALPMIDNFEPAYSEVLEVIANDKNVDCIAIVTFIGLGMGFLQIFTDLLKKTSKPMALWVYSQKLAIKSEFVGQLGKAGFPVYSRWEDAFGALGAIYKYSTIKARLSNR